MTLDEPGDIKNLLPASLLIRCGAIAVDLVLTVAVGTLGLAILSLFTPVDSPAAQPALAFTLVAACVYIAWGRNRFASVGRQVFRLEFARVAAPNARPGRPVTVHMDAQPVHSIRTVGIAAAVVVACIVLSAVSLRQVIQTTMVFAVVRSAAPASQPMLAKYGSAVALADFPTALLIGKYRAYVQVEARLGERDGLLDWFLVRRPGPGQTRSQGPWHVEAVHESSERRFAEYALQAPAGDIPESPTQ